MKKEAQSIIAKTTEIPTPGVYRCCLSSLSDQILEQAEWSPGDDLACRHCKRTFILNEDGIWEPQEYEDEQL